MSGYSGGGSRSKGGKRGTSKKSAAELRAVGRRQLKITSKLTVNKTYDKEIF